MSRLLGLYPAAWRARYESEVRDLLLAHPPTPGERIDLLRGAVDAWIHPQVRRRAAPATEDPRSRLVAPAVSILGGLLVAAGGLATVNATTIGSDGYVDRSAGVVALLAGLLLTALASVAMAPDGAPRRAAWTMVAGAAMTVLPWPILALGFFTWIAASILFGAVLIARGRVLGFVPVAIGLALATFNTETDHALVAVPVGLLWIMFALAHLRPGAAATLPVPAAGEA